jgi:hypothetical protein
MTRNGDPRIAPAAARQKQDAEAPKPLKPARASGKAPSPKPTLEGMTRREGAPEPASKH